MGVFLIVQLLQQIKRQDLTSVLIGEWNRNMHDKMDRFRLEEMIQQVRQTKEDLDNLMWKICDDPAGHTEDDLHNCLIGISEMHDIRCNRLMECFEKLLESGDIK